MLTWFALALAIAGFGVSVAMPAVQAAVMSSVESVDMGRASGVFNTLRQFGGVVGVTVVGAVFSTYGDAHTAEGVANGFNPGIAVSAAFSLIGAAIAIFLPKGRVVPMRTAASAQT